jgi:hypothetical protein
MLIVLSNLVFKYKGLLDLLNGEGGGEGKTYGKTKK